MFQHEYIHTLHYFQRLIGFTKKSLGADFRETADKHAAILVSSNVVRKEKIPEQEKKLREEKIK